METITTIIREAWESYSVRVLVVALALGAITFYLLSMAVATVNN